MARTFSLRLIAGVASLAMALTACQATPATAVPPTGAPSAAAPSAVPATPTAVLPATATAPAATATATPTATATGTPAVTVIATPDPNQGVSASPLYEDKFDGARWGWNFKDDLVTFALANGQLNGVMSRSDSGWRISIGPDVTAGDQQLRLALRTNLCYPKDEYGLFFRGELTSNAKFNGYLFKLNCAGQARVEALRDSVPSVLMDWTTTPAIQAGAPAENTLLVWAAKDQFNFYVNDKYVGSLTDKAFASGGFGLYLSDRTQGGLSVSFTALALKAVQAP